MSGLRSSAGFMVVAGLAALAVLTGCGTAPPGTARPAAAVSGTQAAEPAQDGSAQNGSAQAGGVELDSAQRACSAPGSYLTAVRTGKHGGFDRIVFQFAGGLPVVRTERVTTVYNDPKGTPVPLAGKSRLHVVFRGASAFCPRPAHRTWTGPAVLTPRYPQLLMVKTAGDFEGYLSFGIGLAARGGYHVTTLTGPDRVVIDFSHPGAH